MLDAEAAEEPDQVLGGEVAGGALGVGAATETFARKNLNRTVEESIAMFAPVVERAHDTGLWVRAYVSMCFGDP